jgi:hypothetical protein
VASTTTAAKIAGRRFQLTPTAVRRAMRRVLPEPLQSHYVVIGERRYPPKQVIAEVTGLDRADFTTHQARRTLMRLGFQVGRRPTFRDGGQTAPTSVGGALLDTLGPLVGQWVAVADDEVLVAADSPQEVIEWLSRHDVQGSMFRVPEDARAATGLAPL